MRQVPTSRTHQPVRSRREGYRRCAERPAKSPIVFAVAPDAVVDVTDWPVVAQEPRGDEEKDWIAPAVEVALTREHWWLFKPIKRGRRTGYRRMDDVAEYVTAGLARLLDLPSAEVHMAVRDGDEGIISRHVAPPDWELESRPGPRWLRGRGSSLP